MIYLWLAWMWMFIPPKLGDTRAFEDQHNRWDVDNMIYFCPKNEPEVEAVLKAKGLV